jgi:hypothetical protein
MKKEFSISVLDLMEIILSLELETKLSEFGKFGIIKKTKITLKTDI